MSDQYTNNLRTAVANSGKCSRYFKLPYIGSEQLLYGLVSVGPSAASQMLEKVGVTKTKLFAELKRITSLGVSEVKPEFTPNCKGILMGGRTISSKAGVSYVSTEHVLLSLLENRGCKACSIMRTTFRVDLDLFEKSVSDVVYKVLPTNRSSNVAVYGQIDEKAEEKAIAEQQTAYDQPVMENASAGAVGKQEQKTPLDGFGIDLTLCAKQGKLDPVIGREEEIERVIRTLSRRTKNSPVLVGEAGVGKSAVIEGLAQKIILNEVPDSLAGKSVFSLNLSGLIAGAKYRGEFEERFKRAIDYLKTNKNVILFIDEIHNLVGAGSASDGMDAAEMIKPELARGELQVIGATTTDEYRKYIESDPALERRFQPITVDPPTPEQAKAILSGLRDKYEAHHCVEITDGAISAAVHLSVRYITDRNLPDKAIDLIDEAAARARISATAYSHDIKLKEDKIRQLLAEREYCIDRGDTLAINLIDSKLARLRTEIRVLENNRLDARSAKRFTVTAEDIAQVISEWTHIPLTKIGQEESERLLKLEEELHLRVIGQEEAVNSVARAIRRARANLKDPKRPNGSFIFVGPTGVGKTELSKALAEAVFGDENALIRIDMSEYMEKHDVSKLIGAPPGFVGFDEEGQLSEKVRKKPYSLVLFDEIEKAHPDIFNLLLQILDDGRLTDSKGRLVDFKNTIIIMTSNIGAGEAEQKRGIGFGSSDSYVSQKDAVFTALKKHFRPEFLNRVDDIITFRKLTKEECGKIVNLLLNGLKKRMENLGIQLTVDLTAEQVILDLGFDPEYGARPLKRVIQQHVEDMLSEEIISSRIKRGDHILLSGENNDIVYAKI